MLKKIFILIYIILFNISFSNCKKVVIPFQTVKNTHTNYIKSLIQSQIYAKLEIGDTRQIVYLAISTETYLFAIESYLINENFYSAKKSTSYKNNTYMDFYGDYQRMKYGDILNETFYFQDSVNTNELKKYYNIMFDYITGLSKGSSGEDNGYIDNNITLMSGVIGLQISRKYSERDEIFLIKSLKNIDAIDKIVWSIEYKNDDEGYLILGEYPHQYDNNYTKDDFDDLNCITFDYEFYWYFIFTDIKIGENKMHNYRTAEYSPQLGLIIGTSEYKEFIDNYFNKFGQLCTLNKIEYKAIEYTYYQCDKNINVDDFEQIVFIHRDSGNNFNLDKNDLFVDYNDKKYFLVIFQRQSYNQRWKLGKPFVKKYKFAFDHDSKSMLYYKNSRGKGKNNKNKSYLYIIACVLGILVIALGIFIGKILFGKKKKKKANELEDNNEYFYKEPINEDNNNENNPNL